MGGFVYFRACAYQTSNIRGALLRAIRIFGDICNFGGVLCRARSAQQPHRRKHTLKALSVAHIV
jgi:hypothetical protein